MFSGYLSIAQRNGRWLRACRRADDERLLTHVSDLSGHCEENHRHDASRAFLLVGAALAALLLASPAAADPHDRDALRQAVSRGEIRPLVEILDAVRSKVPGEIIGVEVESKQGRWLYELRVLDAKGRLFEVYVDARTGSIERIREK